MREVLGVVTIRFLAVTGNSCLSMRSWIVFWQFLGWLRWDLCQLWHKKRCRKVIEKLLVGKGRCTKQVSLWNMVPEWECHTSTTTGMNSFRYSLFWYEIWGRYHVNKNREIYGIGMWGWTHSGTDSFRYHVNGPLHGACFPIRSWNLCCLLNGRVFEGRF